VQQSDADRGGQAVQDEAGRHRHDHDLRSRAPCWIAPRSTTSRPQTRVPIPQKPLSVESACRTCSGIRRSSSRATGDDCVAEHQAGEEEGGLGVNQPLSSASPGAVRKFLAQCWHRRGAGGGLAGQRLTRRWGLRRCATHVPTAVRSPGLASGRETV
jgi:hypothetical protein